MKSRRVRVEQAVVARTKNKRTKGVGANRLFVARPGPSVVAPYGAYSAMPGMYTSECMYWTPF